MLFIYSFHSRSYPNLNLPVWELDLKISENLSHKPSRRHPPDLGVWRCCRAKWSRRLEAQAVVDSDSALQVQDATPGLGVPRLETFASEQGDESPPYADMIIQAAYASNDSEETPLSEEEESITQNDAVDHVEHRTRTRERSGVLTSLISAILNLYAMQYRLRQL